MIDRPFYTDRIMAFAGTPFVKVLSGVRRCGKSTIAALLAQKLQKERNVPAERIVTMHLDSGQYGGMTAKDLFRAVQGRLSTRGKTYVFLDEVQEIAGWERAANSLASEHDIDLYVTLAGSAAKMLSSDTATYLTGRYISFCICTLSFAEHLAFKRHYAVTGDVHAELADYIRLGGFPAAHLRQMQQDEVQTLVQDICSSALYADIVKRSRTCSVDLLERTARYAFANAGRPVSARAAADCLKSRHRPIGRQAVKSCLAKLEEAGLLHRCRRCDLRSGSILQTRAKFYPADTSLCFSLLGCTQDIPASALENAVFLELCRRGYDTAAGSTPDGSTVFAAQKQNNRLYVQVQTAPGTGSERTVQRQYEQLLKIRDNHPKYVLRTDSFAGGSYKGIACMHAADFLLGL